MSALISPVQIADLAWFDTLTPDEQDAFAWDLSLWLRPEQRLLLGGWRSTGWIAGRGNGKTYGICAEINRWVDDGVVSDMALMGPTEKRTNEIQVQGLIDTAPPWNRPLVFKDQLVWPNGARATLFSAEAGQLPRGGSFDLSWMTELLEWPSGGGPGKTALDTYKNVTTATRKGANVVLWDTTSRGQNELILQLLAWHEDAPEEHRIFRGSTFDNPLLTRAYLRDECRKYPKGSRAALEELYGQVFSDQAGALFKQAWLDAHRRPTWPDDATHRILSVDPNKAKGKRNDDCGILCGRVSESTGHVYVDSDRSGKHEPGEWGDTIVRECLERNAAGVVIERQGLDDHAFFTVESRAREYARAKGITVDVIRVPRDQTIPKRRARTIYVKDINARSSKLDRADAPASETELGRVHLVGEYPALERELTNYDGTGPSPNRFDAYAMLVTELAGLGAPAATPERDVQAAMQAAQALRARMARSSGRRTI